MALEDIGCVATWGSSPVYSRYWRHYHQAMTWYQRHCRAYSKALEAAHGPVFYGQRYPGNPHRYTDWHGGSDEATLVGRERRAFANKGLDSEEGGNADGDSGSDEEIECDVSDMEITEELREYFAQTEKHREELRKRQQIEAEEHASYVPADQDLHRGSWLGSGAPPLERPGERRSAEMRKLYGEEAAKVQAMEAAMQMTFDRNCDRKLPKYWPVIPLRL